MEKIVIWCLIACGALSLLLGIFPSTHDFGEHASMLRTTGFVIIGLGLFLRTLVGPTRRAKREDRDEG